MTPEQHYAEAERLVRRVVEGEGDATPPAKPTTNHDWIRDTIALAGAHIGLAYAGTFLDLNTAPDRLPAPGEVG